MLNRFLIALTFAVTIGSAITCSSNQYPVELHRVYSANAGNEKLEIWIQNSVVGQKVHTGEGTGHAYQEVVSSFCWEANTYIFTLSSTENSGWTDGSYFYVNVDGVELLRGTLTGTPRKEMTLFLKYLIPSMSSWKYSNTAPPDMSWTMYSQAWPEYYPGNFPSATSTRYYLRDVTLTNEYTSKPILEIAVYTHQGFILYVNGNEVNRFNLPSSGVNHNTMCSQTLGASQWVRVSLSGAKYLTGSTIHVAVEVHPDPLTASGDDFKAIAIPVEQLEMNSLVDVAVTSNIETVTAEQLTTIVDGLSSTYLTATVPADQHLTLTFQLRNHREWINAYSIQSSSMRPAADPREWKLSGSTDGEKWVQIDYRTNEVFSERNQVRRFRITGHRNTFSWYRLEIVERLDEDESRIQLGDVTMFIMKEQEGLEVDLRYKVDTAYYVGVTDELVLEPTYPGYTDFTITPELPEAFSFNNQSGVIMGAISESLVNSTLYRVNATNAYTGEMVSTEFTLAIEMCDTDTKALLELWKFNVQGSNGDYISIGDGNFETYSFNGRDSVSTDIYRYCMNKGNYKLRLASSGRLGWPQGSYIEMYLYDELNSRVSIGRRTLHDITNEYIPFSTTLDLPKEDKEWFVYVGQSDPTADWTNTPGSASAEWQSYHLENGVGPAVDRPVWFIKRQVQINAMDNQVQSYELSVYCRSGVVVYVNNKEIYRANVVDQPVTSNSTITGGSSSPYWHHVTGLRTDWNPGVNNLAIAVVNTPANRNITIDANVRLYFSLSSHAFPRTEGMEVIASNARTGYPASNLIDSDYNTYTLMSRPADVNSTVYWDVHFLDDSSELINYYCMVANSAAARYDPVMWTVYGSDVRSDDMEQWTELQSVEHVKWTVRGQPGCFYMPTVTQAYRYYRFELQENAGQVPDNLYSLGELELYTMHIAGMNDIDLSYSPNTVTAYYGFPINSMQPTQSSFRQCYTTPALPSGISIDANTGVISGTPVAAMEMTTYSVTCVNPRGTVRMTTVTITIQQCATPNVPFILEVPNVGAYGSNNRMDLKSGGATILSVNSFANFNSHLYTICSEPKFYSLSLRTGDYGRSDRYVIVRLADNRELFRLSFPDLMSEDSHEFYPFYSVDASSSWRYQYGEQPLEGWEINNGTDTWATAEAGNFPATESITQYYTTTFTVSDTTKFVAVETQLRQQAGVMVRLNGQLIMMSNIPVGSVTNTTLASAQYAVAQIRKNSNANRNLLQATNVLAVEIHRGASIPSMNVFQVKFLLLPDKQPRMMEGSVRSTVDGIADHPVSMAMDQNTNTYYEHRGICEGTDLIWSYDGASQHFINKYSMGIGYICANMLPTSWNLYGSRDGSSWTLLDVHNGITWSNLLTTNVYNFANNNNYALFKIHVTQCQGNRLSETCPYTGLHINSIIFGVGAVDYTNVCEAADGFNSVPSGFYSYAECDSDHSGYRRRLCQGTTFGSVESFCTVSAPSSFSYPQESYELVRDEEVSPAIEPTIICADCSFSVSPSFPTGLVLDESTGVISGTPLNETQNTAYTITAMNVAGSASVVLNLLSTNETVHCYVDLLNGWESTAVNETAIKNCPNLVDYEGNMTRVCMPGSPAVWGPVVDNCVLLLPNITLPNNTYTFMKNQQIEPIVPIITGSQITSRTINPILPAGLYFNPLTAEISGKPTQRITSTVFTITITNNNGQATATLTITVSAYTCPTDGNWPETDSGDTAYRTCTTNMEGDWYRVCSAGVPPVWQQEVNQCKYTRPVVTYASSTFALQLNAQVNIQPTSTQGYITNWSLTGTLPSGLTFQNGVISGTPNQETAVVSVTVTASNPDKMTQVTLSFSVSIYSCQASGVWPTTIAGQTATRECENVQLMEGSMTRACRSTSGGATWDEVVDTCKYKAPAIVYPVTTITARKGEPIMPVTPTLNNQIDSITISPQLPAGLAFHSQSGVISGTPTGDASNQAYTVHASNRDASTDVILQITVSVAACAASGVWESTERGEEAYAWCDGAAGIQVRVCGNPTDTDPVWKQVDTSGCVSKPENQKPGEGQSFVRFTLQLGGVTSAGWDAKAYAAVRRVMATGLASQSVRQSDIMIESYGEGTFSALATGIVLNMRVATGSENGETMKAAITTLTTTTLTTMLRQSGVAALGMATPSVVESSFKITKYSLFNSLASTLVILIVVVVVLVILLGVYFFVRKGGKNDKKHGHDRLRQSNRAGTRTHKSLEEKSSKKKSKRYEEEEEEKPRKKKSKRYEEEEEERPRKKKSPKYDDSEEERPRKKKSKSKKYDDSD